MSRILGIIPKRELSDEDDHLLIEYDDEFDYISMTLDQAKELVQGLVACVTMIEKAKTCD